jgi:arsenite oxidase small subunit
MTTTNDPGSLVPGSDEDEEGEVVVTGPGDHGGNGHDAHAAVAVPEGEPTSGPWHRSHFFIPPTGPWPDDVPKNQDLEWWRYRDDPRGARRAELRIVFCWMITLLSGLGLAVTYCVAGYQSQVIGAFLTCGFGGLGAGLILWARDLLPGIEVTASLGPRPHTSLYSSGWYAGAHVVTEDGTRLKPSDLLVNGILTVFPEGRISDAQSSTVLINLGNAPFVVAKGREGWQVQGIVAFSKICTHAGCPVGLYNVESHQLVCPCHQSTFDVLLDCKPVFGPASRSLPQLALATDEAGYLIAQGDYDQAVGPGFWNR